MDFTKFVSMLDLKALFFARSDLLGDAFEGAGSIANFKLRPILDATPDRIKALSEARGRLRKKVFTNCWHMNERESAAMWKLYARSNEAVAVQSTYQLLHSCLPAKTYLGPVHYIDYENDFLPEDDLLRAFMCKRMSFEHERELRALIRLVPEEPETFVGYTVGPIGRTVAVNLHDLIQNIHVAPTAPTWFADLVRNVMSKYQLDKPVVESSLDDRPVF